jgi:hypothetical protein
VSAHYGPMARPSFRILFDPAELTEVQLAARYPFIPADRRLRHYRAVQALGDWHFKVGTLDEPGRRSVGAYLGSMYTEHEEDNGLRFLPDLYRLEHLYYIGADLSDRGMETIGTLSDLKELRFSSVWISKDGLRSVQNLKNLEILQLGVTRPRDAFPHVAAQFTDESLRFLVALPKLRRLELYGRGFTKQAIRYLKQMKGLKEVVLQETLVSDADLAEFRNVRPDIEWSR